MKNRILLAAIFAIPVGLFVYFWFFPVAEKKSSALENKISQAAAMAAVLVRQNPNMVAIINSNFARVQAPPENLGSAAAGKISVAPAGQPSPLQFTNFAPATVLQNVSRAVRQYGEMFGGNPVGNNFEITRQLGGENPKRINFLNAEAGMRVDENGEMVDAWGTPYFFHQLSGVDMEIHSAGPDKIMWTSDDLIAR